jgi:hypothetical protein
MKSVHSDTLGWFVRVCLRRTFNNKEDAEIWKANEYDRLKAKE